MVLTSNAKKQLDKMDKPASERIYSWLKGTLDYSKNPYTLGKKLTGDLGGLIRYRVGNHRIIAEIRDNELIILVIEIEHRKKIYDRF